MSKISLSPDSNGTGVFTIASPNSNTNRTLTLPDDTGTIVTNSGNQAGSFTTLNTSGAVVFNDAGADVDFRVEGDTNTYLLFVDASNEAVAVGTSVTGSAKFIVNGSGTSNSIMTNTAASFTGGGNACLIGDDGTDVLIGVGNSGTNLSFLSRAAGVYSKAMTIDPSGNVGIGTSSPSNKLQVAGNIGIGNGNFLGWGNLDTLIYGDSSSNVIYFRTNTAERMRITSGGYLKASNFGTYASATGSYHEFLSDVDNTNVRRHSTNASFSARVDLLNVTRSATSAYSFLLGYSGNLGDLEFNLRGDGNAYADGSWNGSGADYAEYFESATGEAIPRGTTVVLENNKVRAATADDPVSSIIGVVRPKEFGKGSMVVGNLAWNMWTDKYITDDFGVYEMEDHEVVEWEEQVLETEAIEAVVDEEGNEVSPAQEATYKTVSHSYESHAIPEGVTVPANATRKTHDENGKKFQHRKLNPAWSAEVEYTPREERPEWLIIGLLGQVPILKGQPMGDRWVKMRDISETVEEWMIR